MAQSLGTGALEVNLAVKSSFQTLAKRTIRSRTLFSGRFERRRSLGARAVLFETNLRGRRDGNERQLASSRLLLGQSAFLLKGGSRRNQYCEVKAGQHNVRAAASPKKEKTTVQVAEKPTAPAAFGGSQVNTGIGNGAPALQSTGVFPAWVKTVEECLEHYQVDLEHGLTNEQVAASQAIYGYNELEKEPGTPFWKLVAEQFDDALVQILLAAALVSGGLAVWDAAAEGQSPSLGDFTEPGVILLIVILNACIGVWQANRAESTLQALKEMQSDVARTIRNGREIPDLLAKELVPGDIVELRVGDKAPADMRIIKLKSATLRVQQASLTGESQPVLKQTGAGLLEDVELQGKENMVFAGSSVSNGTALGIVTGTGMKTEIGKIQRQIQAASQEAYETPLTRKLDEFADTLTKVVGLVCILVWVINYKYFLSWDVVDGSITNLKFDFEECTYYFKVAVALAVAAIPEGLPAVISTCLALGTRRMAESNAIVRRLPSVETLGCTTVICSDKTGTLTTNQMSATLMVTPGSTPESLLDYTVKGTTYDPGDGAIIGLPEHNQGLETFAKICALCNDAGLTYKNGQYAATGMPTEAALKVLVEKIGVPDKERKEAIAQARKADPESATLGSTAYWCQQEQRLATLEFDRNRKSMSVIGKPKAGGPNRLLVKGAAECILDRCDKVLLSTGEVVPLTDSMREQVLKAVEGPTSKALRCLALAVGTELKELADYDGTEQHPGHQSLMNASNYAEIESKLAFVGLAGIQDPARPEVKTSMEDCRKAGIRVVVITGDNKATAEAVARDIGLLAPTEDASQRSMTGSDFMRLGSKERAKLLMGSLKKGLGFIFSRAEPSHKQEIVRLLKNAGEVVAMTGDGVNDAPALKSADIGIAMGISGTEVAKEASDMVLADDNFATIVTAVCEGRGIYANMKAFIRYLISSNIGEVVSIFLTAAVGFPQGLLPVQLLWVNLVTDGAPATALGFNPPERGIMERPPRSSTEGLVSGWLFFRFLIIGVYVGVATVAAFAIWYSFPDFLGLNLGGDGHMGVPVERLMRWGECPLWTDFAPQPFTAGDRVCSFEGNPCAYFEEGKVKASTLAMTTLVMIEMFNAFNALSENNSLLTTPPWVNKFLLAAVATSIGLHCLILYVPYLQDAFGVVPLNGQEWLLTIALSAPIIAVDEVLKWVGRRWFAGSKDHWVTVEPDEVATSESEVEVSKQ